MDALETRLKRQAHALGFELVGIAPATAADGFDRLRDWLGRGFAGTMDYMRRHAEARREPSSILPQVRSVVMVGMNYNPEGGGLFSRDPEGSAPALAYGSRLNNPSPRGKVACYARGADYHDVL